MGKEFNIPWSLKSIDQDLVIISFVLRIPSGIILKMNLPLYKGYTLEITNKW
jgi:hypothetical protein